MEVGMLQEMRDQLADLARHVRSSYVEAVRGMNPPWARPSEDDLDPARATAAFLIGDIDFWMQGIRQVERLRATAVSGSAGADAPCKECGVPLPPSVNCPLCVRY